jgi:uncharacterized protein (DUF427 family)
MPRAIWSGAVLAESETTQYVEGNHYFPPESVNKAYLKKSGTHTTCPWRGEASYYHIAVNDNSLEDGAWYYPNPTEAAMFIKGHVAFWRGVEVVE